MGELRVMTLNVGSLLEPEWDQRRHEVVAWIDQKQPDIVCLQEIHESDTTENTGAWIAEHAGGEWHHVFGGGSFAFPGFTPGVVFGSAILSRQPIDQTDCWLLPVIDDPDDPIPAAVPWELLHARTGGVDVFSTHLTPAPTHSNHRRLQVRTIDEYVRKMRGSLDTIVPGERRGAIPAILCGDFNAEPDSDEIRYLCGLTSIDDTRTFWQDAWRVAGNGPGLTQNWRTHPLAAGLNVHRKRIDYIFVGDPFMRAGDRGRVLDVEVICDQPLTGVMASDHSGLVATIAT